MPRLPMYEQQTRPSGTEMSPRAAGVGMGQAMMESGDALQQIGANIQRRADVIEQTRLYGQFELEAMQMGEALMAGEDITNPDAVKQYSEALRQKMDQMVSNFRGTSASRSALKAQLENAVVQQTKGVMAAQIKAQTELVTRSMDNEFNRLARLAFDAPGELITALSEVDRVVDQYKDAIPTQYEQQFRQQGRSTLLQGAVNGALVRGDIETAERLMADPQYEKLLNPAEYSKLKLSVAGERGKIDLREQTRQQNIAVIESLRGAPLSEAEKMRVPSESVKGLGTINMYEMITGKPATSDVVSKAFGLASSSGSNSWFGSGMEGRATQFVWENAEAYAMGLMNPDEARRFRASVEWMSQTKTVRDPITGQNIQVPGQVPPEVRQAYDMGIQYYGGRSRLGEQDSRPTSNASAAPMGSQAPAAPMAEYEELGAAPDFVQPETAADARGPFVAQGGDSQSAPAEVVATEDRPLFDMMAFVTGPEAKLRGAASRIPFTDAGGQPPEYTIAQQRMARMREKITNTMRPESKIADQYRRELNALNDITGRIFDNPEQGFRDLSSALTDLKKTKATMDKIASGQVPQYVDQVRHAMEISFLIQEVLSEFQMPEIRATSREEVEKLPSGTRFFYGNSYVPQTKR